MDTIDYQTEANEFYKETYGVNIASFPYPLKQSLENLYIKGIHLKPAALYSKLSSCGIDLHMGVLLRTRMAALVKRVPQEPKTLTKEGARLWHQMVERPFDASEIQFMLRNFPEQTRELYPSLYTQN